MTREWMIRQGKRISRSSCSGRTIFVKVRDKTSEDCQSIELK